jgi:hypothetical protein
LKAGFAAALALGLAVLGGTRTAWADALDPAIERLVLDPACHNAGPNPDPSKPFGAFTPQGGSSGRLDPCEPDNAAFARLINQYGFALAPTAMHSARTTGFGGFHLSMEAVYSTIDNDATYWEQGTQGTRDPNTNQPSVRNTAPPGLLQVYSLKFRKGFGFGLELTGIVGFMPQTSILSGGADVRLSILEGFRTGVPGYVPDFAVGAGVRTITGTSQFQLTTMGIDGQFSKPIPIADSSVIMPWIGYQYLFIWGDSGLVDLTPATDAIQACNYTGPAVPGNPDPDKTNTQGSPTHVYDGGPVCDGGQPFDFNNNTVFDTVRIRRHRMLIGVNYRYEMVMIGGQFITDLVKPQKAQVQEQERAALEGEDSQFSFVLELGAMF